MMKDSKLDPNWLMRAAQSYPIRPSPADPTWFLTGPVRLNFTNILTTGKDKMENGQVKKGKFGATIMFLPNADLSLLKNAWLAKCRQDFPGHFNPQTGEMFGLHSPFHDQAEKAFGAKPYQGFTPGAQFINTSTQFKPGCVDAMGQPITDEKRVYPGVWAFATLNLYTYGVNPPQPKKGVGFGLQSVMLIADDLRILGGGGSDPTKEFAGISIEPNFDAANAFASAPGAQSYGAAAVAQTMPGNYVGQQGALPVQPVTSPVDDAADLY